MTGDQRESYVYEYYNLATGDIFYVGKGKGNRINDMTGRGQEVLNRIQTLNEFGRRKVAQNLSDQEAGDLEYELILKYRNQGVTLTNIQPGGTAEQISVEKISEAKYLIFLIQKNLIKMSYEKITEYTGCHTKIIMDAKDDFEFKGIKPKVPVYIQEILEKFHVNNFNDDKRRFGYVKYLLELIDKQVIKMNQVQLAEYYGLTPANISSIKKGKSRSEIPPIAPDNLYEILMEYDVHTLSEREMTMGMLSFIVRLQEQQILDITAKQIGEILGVSPYTVTEARRSPESGKRMVYPEVKPSPEIMFKLAPYFKVNQAGQTSSDDFYPEV